LKLINRNIRLFYVLEAILACLGGIILPVYVVYFRHYDISLFQVALLAAVFEATVLLFEIPTGLFADRYGRKLSTSVGFLLFGVSALVFFLWRGFAGFLVAEIIFGIAETFISGALEALTVDSLHTEDRNKYLARLFRNRTMVKTIALLCGMTGGGILAKYYLPFLFVPIVVLAALGLVISLFLREHKQQIEGTNDGGIWENLKSVKRAISANKIILAVFAVGILSNIAFEGVDQYWQVLFAEIKGIDVSYFGLITACGAVMVIPLVWFGERLFGRLLLYLTGTFILISVSLYLALQTPFPRCASSMVAYFALKELIKPALSTHLNRHYNSGNRAAFLSSFNMVCSVGEVAAGIMAGLLAANFGVPFVFYFSAVVALLVPVISLLIITTNKGHQ
jgi:MFS transporter, DHA3 family, tetracycline resistance protein